MEPAMAAAGAAAGAWAARPRLGQAFLEGMISRVQQKMNRRLCTAEIQHRNQRQWRKETNAETTKEGGGLKLNIRYKMKRKNLRLHAIGIGLHNSPCFHECTGRKTLYSFPSPLLLLTFKPIPMRSEPFHSDLDAGQGLVEEERHRLGGPRDAMHLFVLRGWAAAWRVGKELEAGQQLLEEDLLLQQGESVPQTPARPGGEGQKVPAG